MKVLVACEFSGIVRDAFIARGHDAWSCDLLPTERPGNHFQEDARNILDHNWDLIIAHPPCTDLSVSGARYFEQKKLDGRQNVAIELFMAFANANCEKICIENPVSIMSTIWRKPDQIIQPWQFGHSESKKTCLWLKGLNPLTPTNILIAPPAWIPCPCGCGNYVCTIHKTHAYDCGCPEIDDWKVDPYFTGGRWNNQTPSGQNKLAPSPTRAMERSRTYQGIADAMADQWGAL